MNTEAPFQSVAAEAAIVARVASEPLTEPEHCGNCRFWTEEERDRFSVIGRCRRFPPTIASPPVNEGMVIHHTYFPETEAQAWCGEWAPPK